MTRKRALFVTLHAVEPDGSIQPLPRPVAGLLGDYVAKGYRVFVVTDRLAMTGRGYDSGTELLRALRGERVLRHAIPVTGCVLLENAYDPGPFWAAARCYGLDLGRSSLVSRSGELSGAARSAGVGFFERGDELFGLAA